MEEQRNKDTTHPEKAQRMDYPRRNNPGSQNLPLINKHSSLNSLSFCLHALFVRFTNLSSLVYGKPIENFFSKNVYFLCKKNKIFRLWDKINLFITGFIYLLTLFLSVFFSYFIFVFFEGIFYKNTNTKKIKCYCHVKKEHCFFKIKF
ncbi:hypothetical protein EDEG_04165 [Edhazardia aedis USNM 41457]|uniref:Uncharacterized protein n=1 Tax=Edhazardia aedis (strain USNM 41457) TaxID=1003232 RepID=J9DUE8_EDHAE|nr:hypothetical protein EDEG_04165 [Edhazardia aedis USNM 41457]|eukprot:EJW04922.1 hypothetical protein EDEG_04165 [Edhazardia aedis USNM 41457]